MIGYPKPSARRRTLGQRSKKQTGDNREGVQNRDGRQCIVAGSVWADLFPCTGGLTIQHAKGRGMDGSAMFDSPELLRAMCWRHNELQTSDAAFAAQCLFYGWALERHRADIDPTHVPVRYPDGADYFLTPDFQRSYVAPGDAAELRHLYYGKAS